MRCCAKSIHRFSFVVGLLWLSVSGAAFTLRFAPVIELQPDPELGATMRALGPLCENGEVLEDERVLALFRPLYCQFDAPHAGILHGRDILWPVGVTRRGEREEHQRFLLALHTDRDVRVPDSRECWWLLPVFFVGRNRSRETYAAIFPILGEIDEIASFDRVRFLLFPLYLETQRGRSRSESILWPIFSHTRSDRVEKWRVFPLMGISRTRAGVRRFFLWPFGHTFDAKSPRTGRATRGFFLLPLVGWSVSRPAVDAATDSRAWTVLWPFFSGATTPRGRRLHCPWPFYLQQKVLHWHLLCNLEKRYFWPFFGTRKRGTDEVYRFLFWPLVHQRRSGGASKVRQGLWVLPFYWSATTRADGKSTSTYRQLWPLVRFSRVGKQGRVCFPTLWPGPTPMPIERNYAPLWRLYTRRDEGDLRRNDLLWGLVEWSTRNSRIEEAGLFPFFHCRRSRARGTATLSVFGGVYHRESGSEGVRHRLFWFVEW